MPPSILLMKSGLDLARCASRKCAPTEVPDLNSWSPSTWASLFFGNWEYKATIFSANCFVRSLRSPLILPFSPLIFHLCPFGIFADPSVSVFIVSLFHAGRTRFLPRVSGKCSKCRDERVPSLPVHPLGIDFVADQMELFGRWRGSLADNLRHSQRPADFRLHILRCNTGIELPELHLALGVVEVQDGLIGNHQLGPSARQAQPGAAVAAGQVPRASKKIQLVDKRPPL